MKHELVFLFEKYKKKDYMLLRLLPVQQHKQVSSVYRELGTRGSAFIVWDTNGKLLLASQGLKRIALVINQLAEHHEDRVSFQSLYMVAEGKLVKKKHKGYSVLKVSLQDLPSEFMKLQRQGFARVGVCASNDDAWTIS